jgi:Ca-activated chloride channel family protein
MREIEIGNLTQLHWLWPVVAVAALGVFAVAIQRRAALRLASKSMLARILPNFSTARQLAGKVLASLALVFLVLSLIDLRWGNVQREIPQQGIEVMFVLDVSRSMLAEDVAPNRLERAKQMIKDTLDEMAGDRVGLTVFSGDARLRIPLTNHYDDFKQTLDEVAPEDVYRGGSRLGDALLEAVSGFHGKTNRHKAIVLISDGEDQDSEPLRVAREVQQEHGVKILTIGLGDADQGARIPVVEGQRRTYLQHEGQQVWSKLNGEILRQIATETGGAYVPAGTKQVSMADVYHGYIAPMEQTEFETARINAYEARYQWFCAIALLLTLVELAATRRI